MKDVLTVRQREVVEKMKEGWILTNKGYLAHDNADTAIRVRTTTILALVCQGMLEHLMFQGNGANYKLTQKGKEI